LADSVKEETPDSEIAESGGKVQTAAQIRQFSKFKNL
jgi:hypothetical protein